MNEKIFWGICQRMTNIPFEKCFARDEEALHSLQSQPQFDQISLCYERDNQAGIRWLVPSDPMFPKSLLALADPPRVLRILGNDPWQAHEGIAVVGSREPSSISRIWLERHLRETLEISKLMTVSGGARGVDSIAHSISLRLGMPTVALLPSGIGQIYPSSLGTMVDAIIKNGGAIVSEFESDTKMRKHYFQRRNRLIPAFALATLVVEARLRSGTMITAQQSVDQGKPLFVLPSHPMDANSSGSLELICDGATPVRSAADLTLFLLAELRAATIYSGEPSFPN